MSVPAGCNPTTTTGCLGKACDTTGLTVMDIDQKRILACLKNDSGAKVWKVMTQDTECCKEKKTTGGSDGCSDGMTAGFVGGVGGCYITGTPLDVSAPK
ncbi:MAG: hypothetical protein HGA90_04825 [Alphaproteobacteria bacterium]|nr:hypothetical protein [Alphaproteobacteria bacterium]